MSNLTKEEIIAAKTDLGALRKVVAEGEMIIKVRTPICFPCNMATRWTNERGLEDGVDYLEIDVTENPGSDEYLKNVVAAKTAPVPAGEKEQVELHEFVDAVIKGEKTTDVSGVKIQTPWIFNLGKLSFETKDDEDTQLYGYQPSNYESAMFKGLLAAKQGTGKVLAAA